MSQRERVIKMLREREWVSTLDMVFDYILRGGDIIFKLRRKGWVILERTKEGTPYGEYHLVSEPKKEVELDKEWSRFGQASEPMRSSPFGLGNGTENVSSADENPPKSSSPAHITGQGILLPPDMTPKTAKVYVSVATIGWRVPNKGNIGFGK